MKIECTVEELKQLIAPKSDLDAIKVTLDKESLGIRKIPVEWI